MNGSMFLKTFRDFLNSDRRPGRRMHAYLPKLEQAREPTGLAFRVGKNAWWLLIARLGTQGLMLLFTLLLARRLGEAGLGAYAYLAAIIFLGNMLSSFGTDMLIVRETAASGALHLLYPALGLQLLFSAAFVAMVLIIAPGLPHQEPSAAPALRLYSLALFPLAFYTVFSALLRGLERMAAVMWLNLFTAGVHVGLGYFFITPDSSLLRLAWLLLGAQAAAAALAFGLVLFQVPYLRSPRLLPRASYFGLLKLCAPIALLGVLKVLHQKMGIYLLSTLQGAAVTGWFAAAQRPVEAAQIGHIALLGALFPVMARVYRQPARDMPHYHRFLTISGWSLFLMGAAAAALLSAVSPRLIQWLYGPGFEPAVPALRLLAWTLLPFSVNIYFSSWLLAAGQEKQIAVVYGASLSAGVILSLLWIPAWGLPGACLATLCFELLQASLFLAFGRFWRASEPSSENIPEGSL